MVETPCDTSSDTPGSSNTNLTITPSETDIFKALGSFLLNALPTGFQVMQGQQNRTPAPTGSFATMTIKKRERVSTNSHHLTKEGYCEISQPLRLVAGINLFGTQAGDGATCLSTLFRDAYATDWFQHYARNLQPLYASDPTQIVLHTAEDQYEEHWTLELHLQALIRLSIPQESTLTLTLNTQIVSIS